MNIQTQIFISNEYWLNSLIPMASGLLGTIVGSSVTIVIHIFNNKKEAKKRAEIEIKEKETLMRQFYGKLSSLNTIILQTLQLEAYHTLNQQYFFALYNLETNTNLKEKYFEKNKGEYEKNIQIVLKLREYTKEYSDFVGQYYFINPKSEVLKLYSDFFEKSKKENLIIDIENINKADEILKIRNKKYEQLMSFYENEISISLNKITECILHRK